MAPNANDDTKTKINIMIVDIKDIVSLLNKELKSIFEKYEKAEAHCEFINLFCLMRDNLSSWSRYRDIILFAGRLAKLYKDEVIQWPNKLSNGSPFIIKQLSEQYIAYIIICLINKLTVVEIKKYIEYVGRMQLVYCDELAYKMLNMIENYLETKIYSKLLSLLNDIEKDNASQSTESYDSASDHHGEEKSSPTQANGPGLS